MQVAQCSPHPSWKKGSQSCRLALSLAPERNESHLNNGMIRLPEKEWGFPRQIAWASRTSNGQPHIYARVQYRGHGQSYKTRRGSPCVAALSPSNEASVRRSLKEIDYSDRIGLSVKSVRPLKLPGTSRCLPGLWLTSLGAKSLITFGRHLRTAHESLVARTSGCENNSLAPRTPWADHASQSPPYHMRIISDANSLLWGFELWHKWVNVSILHNKVLNRPIC